MKIRKFSDRPKRFYWKWDTFSRYKMISLIALAIQRWRENWAPTSRTISAHGCRCWPCNGPPTNRRKSWPNAMEIVVINEGFLIDKLILNESFILQMLRKWSESKSCTKSWDCRTRLRCTRRNRTIWLKLIFSRRRAVFRMQYSFRFCTRSIDETVKLCR